MNQWHLMDDFDLLVAATWYTQLLHMMKTGLYMQNVEYMQRMTAADHFETELAAVTAERLARKTP